MQCALFNWKVGLVYCMINRAYMICNDWSLFSKEIDYLKNMFTSNGYPKSMIDKYVNQFLNSKFNPGMKAPKEDTVNVTFSDKTRRKSPGAFLRNMLGT